MAPIPTKVNCLQRFKDLNFKEVIDVGVNLGTPELMQVLPDARHHLIEPLSTYFDAITEAYADINHVLYPFALSNTTSQLHLISKSIRRDGIPTHSQITETPLPIDGKYIVDCTTIDVKRFEDAKISVGDDFLLKVDVDGKDREVLEGFGANLHRAAVIIVEATFGSLSGTLSYCIGQGFQLWDIVDLVYYGPALYQCDLVFLRNDLTENRRPPIHDFNRELWQPLSV